MNSKNAFSSYIKILIIFPEDLAGGNEDYKR